MRYQAQAPRKHGLATHARWLKLTAGNEVEEVLLCFMMECVQDNNFRDYHRRLVARLKRHGFCND